MNIEYELEDDSLELRDVEITIPTGGGPTAPVMNECTGDYDYDKRKGALVWRVPVVDANEKSGAMDFTAAQALVIIQKSDQLIATTMAQFPLKHGTRSSSAKHQGSAQPFTCIRCQQSVFPGAVDHARSSQQGEQKHRIDQRHREPAERASTV